MRSSECLHILTQMGANVKSFFRRVGGLFPPKLNLSMYVLLREHENTPPGWRSIFVVQTDQREIKTEKEKEEVCKEYCGSRLPQLLYAYILTDIFERNMNKKETKRNGFMNKAVMWERDYSSISSN